MADALDRLGDVLVSAVLFAPHADDECLFACYLLIRLRAKVVVCLDSGLTRFLEMKDAMGVLGRDWRMLHVDEAEPDWDAVRDAIGEQARRASTLIAPAFEEGGHEHHNEVARIVDALGHSHKIRYVTYRRGQGRTTTDYRVEGTVHEQELKLQALRCYASQIADPDTAPWFPSGAYHTLTEWVA